MKNTSFERLLREGQLGATEIRVLADALAARHAAAERTPDLAPDAFEHARILACHTDLLASSPRADVETVSEAVRRAQGFLEASADRLLARAGAGRIVASALPLRLSDVRFDGAGQVVIRASAASAPACVDDAALELAHLAVSLRLRGHEDLAERLVSHYAGACDDFELYPVIDFYADLCFVERVAAGALPKDARQSLASPADEHGNGQPLLLIMSGAVASGKSSLARSLADELGIVRSVADRVREHLVHGAPGRATHESGWADGFEPGIARRIYAELLRRGELALASGRSIVLDATFPTRRERDAARALARRFGARFRFVVCELDRDEQRRRLQARDRADGDPGAWEAIARRFDEQFVPPEELEADERIVVDTTGGLDGSVEAALQALGHSLRAGGRVRPGGPAGRRPARAVLPQKLRAVSFDCWRTLLVETDWTAAHARRVDALIESARLAGRSIEREAAGSAFDAAWHEHIVAWTRGVATGAPEVARHALDALGVEAGGDALESLIGRWQEASHTGRVRAVEGARHALESLASAGLRLALVCDTGLTPGRVVRQLLDAQGLGESLDVCVFSDEVGLPKPDAAPFRAALEALGVAPEEAAHVGDLRRTDVAGARELGMLTLRLRAVYDDPSPLPEADAVVDSLDDLVEVLGVGGANAGRAPGSEEG